MQLLLVLHTTGDRTLSVKSGFHHSQYNIEGCLVGKVYQQLIENNGDVMTPNNGDAITCWQTT